MISKCPTYVSYYHPIVWRTTEEIEDLIMSPPSSALNYVFTSQDCQNRILLCWTWMNLSFYSKKKKVRS